jgi:hypothetical protein
VKHVRLFAKNYNKSNSTIVSFFVPTLEISVDMLKRQIQKDANLVRQLGLLDAFNLSHLKIGSLMRDGNDKNVFCAFECSESLIANGVKEDTVLLFSI